MSDFEMTERANADSNAQRRCGPHFAIGLPQSEPRVFKHAPIESPDNYDRTVERDFFRQAPIFDSERREGYARHQGT
ncbi:MAG TPA: hypothetical protein VN838_29850 [Bradyrhizobium sp.]|nr:hypothetical protein [Bradyrhizobium sp.]